ncbi:MAG: hypothetical protein WA160_15195 [Pseudobdellovibrio sp.]
MKRNFIQNGLISLVTLSQVFGCAKSAQSSSVVTSGFAMSGSSKTATVAQYSNKNLFSILLPRANALVPTSMVDSAGSAITLSSAWVSIKEVEFETSEIKGVSESAGAEVSFHGPYFVDLLSNTPLTLDTQIIPQALYRRIKIQLHASGGTLPSGAPAQLSSNSIVMVGIVASKNFEFRLNDSTEMNIGGAKSVMPADGGRILVEINFADIFKQIDMSTVTNNEIISASNRHTTTCLSIDASANDVYTCVRKAIEKRGNFGEDRDNDGVLSSGEDSVK